jgi:cobalt transporter subunit CbtB
MTIAFGTDAAVQPVQIPWWTWLVLSGALFGAFLMLQENGLLLQQWETLHEFFHDGRHALGFPCH